MELKSEIKLINENRHELTIDLAENNKKLLSQIEINKSLHHALNEIRVNYKKSIIKKKSELSLQQKELMEKFENDKNELKLKFQNEIENLKNCTIKKDNVEINLQNLQDKISTLTVENDILKSSNDCLEDGSTIIRIIKSTLFSYLKSEPDKKREIFKILCKLLNINSDDINKIVNIHIMF